MIDQKKTAKKVTHFTGRIRLYWQGFDNKPERIITVTSKTAVAAFELCHALYILEDEGVKWAQTEQFLDLLDSMEYHILSYVSSICNMMRLDSTKWDWDWAQDEEENNEPRN